MKRPARDILAGLYFVNFFVMIVKMMTYRIARPAVTLMPYTNASPSVIFTKMLCMTTRKIIEKKTKTANKTIPTMKHGFLSAFMVIDYFQVVLQASL